MIESALSLGEQPFLAALHRVDEAVMSFKERIVGLSQSFQLFGEIEEHFDKLREALDFGSHMGDLAAQTGATAGEMAILSQAFENCGMGADGASPFVSHLQKALSGLNEAGAQTSTAFRQLGVNVMAMRQMPLLDQINALQAAFQRIGNINDRTKIAEDLFGKGGAEEIRFLVNVEGMSEARDQVGGLKAVLDQNAETFGRIARALDALKIKAVQFYAGFAKGLDGDTKRLTDFLNKLDLTGFGEKFGALVRKVSAFIAGLKPLLPLLEILAARFVLGRIASTAFAEAMMMNLTHPVQALQGLIIKLGGLNNAMGAIRFAVFEANIGSLVSAVGALNVAMLAAAAAWAGWQAGAAINEYFTHDKAKTESANQSASMVDTEGQAFKSFDERKGSIHSKEDREALAKTLDDFTAAIKADLTHAAQTLSGDELASAQMTGSVALRTLAKLREQAEALKITPLPAPQWDPIPGRTPVSSLGRIGGGTNSIGHADPHLTALKRLVTLNEEIVKAVSGRAARSASEFGEQLATGLRAVASITQAPVPSMFPAGAQIAADAAGSIKPWAGIDHLFRGASLKRSGVSLNTVGQGVSRSVGSVASIGRNSPVHGDPLLGENRRQTAHLATQTSLLSNLLNAITGSPTASRPPVYHST